MKLITIMLFVLVSINTNAQDQISYLGNAKELLEEEIDMKFVGEELTRRVYKISEELKRFEYSKLNSLTNIEDSAAQATSEAANLDLNLPLYSGRKRVEILPFISAEEAKNNPELWTSSIETAKGTDAHFVIRGVIESAKAEPKLKEGGNQGGVKMYAGFEGSISFNIQIYDLEQDIELEDSKVSDRGLLKSDIIKTATGIIKLGSNFLGRADMGDAAKTNVNNLVDQSLPKTKKEAINEAINRSEKYLRQLFSDTFPMYFPLMALKEDSKNGIQVHFLNYPDSELIQGHRLDLILLIQGKEENFGTSAIEQINEESFLISIKGKDAEKIKKALKEHGNEKIFAKFGKEKLTTKAKISNLF